MLLLPGIHESKGAFHQLNTLDVASPASPHCVGCDIKVTTHRIEVVTEYDMAMLGHHWQHKVREEALSVCLAVLGAYAATTLNGFLRILPRCCEAVTGWDLVSSRTIPSQKGWQPL